jgi:hypothetical protein
MVTCSALGERGGALGKILDGKVATSFKRLTAEILPRGVLDFAGLGVKYGFLGVDNIIKLGGGASRKLKLTLLGSNPSALETSGSIEKTQLQKKVPYIKV